MKCPTCKTNMHAGTATIQRSDLGMIADALLLGRLGTTAHYLYFQPSGAAEAAYIDHTDKALGCPKCHTLVIVPRAPEVRDETLECMSCGKPIPAGATKCADCGWTWGDDLPI